ncbi:MAG: transglutaminase-like domain-containing protein [Candidatus Hodarchaeota archaeon]
MESYGPEYWNTKWERSPIIYRGRALRGEHYNKMISIDVRTFIDKEDEIIRRVIDAKNLRMNSFDETALECQKFVCEFLTYVYDDVNVECPEFWQFPFETLQSTIGDCEDGAILTAGLLINAGIPSWRVKVCAGYVQESPTAPLGGHAYATYLADRPDTEEGLGWVILDWCYLADPQISIQDKPLAKDGGHRNAYKEIWFSFNDEYSWSQHAFEITDKRISKMQQATKEEVLNEEIESAKLVMDEVEKNIAYQSSIEEKIKYRFL